MTALEKLEFDKSLSYSIASSRQLPTAESVGFLARSL